MLEEKSRSTSVSSSSSSSSLSPRQRQEGIRNGSRFINQQPNSNLSRNAIPINHGHNPGPGPGPGGSLQKQIPNNHSPLSLINNRCERNVRDSSGYYDRSKQELSRGPRSKFTSHSPSPTKPDFPTHIRVRRDQFNKSDFQTHYPNSKFYVIKSYSEDDIHKSIKYSVWASTPYGNRKLDAAFRQAESQPTSQCPLFLFFSVNGSGQFVGIAEMIGQVDFNKDMDFWQAEKWNGFFPVQWHIIKDLPNSQLKHIILDHGDDGHGQGQRDVTFTRDTHEIGLKQGLEMLHIFKTYDAKTSLLDDFNFYETREKSLRMRRSCSSKPEYETYDDDIHSYKYNNTLPLTEMQMCGDNDNNNERSMEDLTIPAAATSLSNLSLNDSSA